jgi:hypothetical protein
LLSYLNLKLYDKEEFYVAYSEDYGLSRARSDAEFDRIDGNHDGELDFDEFAVNMAPRILTQTNWKSENLHAIPTSKGARQRATARKVAYSMCCCCFVVEGAACVWYLVKPLVKECTQSCEFAALAYGIKCSCCDRGSKRIHVMPMGHDPLSVPMRKHEASGALPPMSR